MQKLSRFTFILILLVFIFSGCQKDPEGTSEDTGTLLIHLTDAPAEFDSVNITFSQISAHIDSEWVHVRVDPITVNLLDWSNGKSMIIGEADVPAGKYTQIRIIIDSAEVVVDDIKHELIVPSGAKTGLKLGPQFTIEEGSTYLVQVEAYDGHGHTVRDQSDTIFTVERDLPPATSSDSFFIPSFGALEALGAICSMYVYRIRRRRTKEVTAI